MKQALQTRSGIALGFALLSAAAFAQDVVKPVIPAPATPPPVALPTPAQPSTGVPPLPAPADTAPAPGTPAATLPAGSASGPAAPVSAANAPQVSSSYIIGPEDAIAVNGWKEPTVSGAFAGRPDGMISLPLLGDVLAAGLTPMSLGNDLAIRLKKYLTDPLVTVTVTAVNSQHYYLVGEVGHAGALPLVPGMTPIQAIAAAGGLSPYANAKHIYILRTDKGKQVKIPFNYKKAIKDGNQQGVTLAAGDTIVVP